jgi:hypothetical protein
LRLKFRIETGGGNSAGFVFGGLILRDALLRNAPQDEEASLSLVLRRSAKQTVSKGEAR